MTICIAAIAEKKKITAITDKMLTLSAPVITKFEVSENDKAIKLNEKTVALFAGDVIQANEIMALAKDKDLSGDVSNAANKIADSFKNYWIDLVNRNLLSRYNLNLKDFMNKQRSLDENLVRNINDILGKFNLDVEIIVAGIDKNPHIFKITSPGVITSFDSIGYCCIGSGSQHATLSLIENEYHGDFKEEKSLYSLFESKKRAEYDPGVGELCDIVIINDKFIRLDKNHIDEIGNIYNESKLIVNKQKDDTAKKIKKFCE